MAAGDFAEMRKRGRERKIEIEIEKDDATAYDPVDRQRLVCLGAVLSCDEVNGVRRGETRCLKQSKTVLQ